MEAGNPAAVAAPIGTYVVAGSTGLVGTTALLRLKNQPGVRVKALYHRRQPSVFADNISHIKVDLTRDADCRAVVEEGDIVLSLCGILMTAPVMAANPVTPLTQNLLMQARLLEASYLAAARHFLCIASSTGYPASEDPLVEEDMFRGDPAGPYFGMGWLFRYIETLCRLYATKLRNPMPVTVIRPSTIYSEYGDFDLTSAHMLPSLVRKVVERRDPVEVWGSAEVLRDLIHADDLLDACLLALRAAHRFEVFNVAHGREYTVGELLAMILRLDGYKGARILYSAQGPVTGGRRLLDSGKARQLLGFVPKIGMEEGIRRMVVRFRGRWENIPDVQKKEHAR